MHNIRNNRNMTTLLLLYIVSKTKEAIIRTSTPPPYYFLTHSATAPRRELSESRPLLPTGHTAPFSSSRCIRLAGSNLNPRRCLQPSNNLGVEQGCIVLSPGPLTHPRLAAAAAAVPEVAEQSMNCITEEGARLLAPLLLDIPPTKALMSQ